MARGDNEAEIQARIEWEMQQAPPLTPRQQELIRATFAELRTRQANGSSSPGHETGETTT